MHHKIPVTKAFLPPKEEYDKLLSDIWETGWLTNNGKYLVTLEKKLEEYLGVKHCILVSNGTIAIQLALKSFNITKEVITTPYSYVATTNALLWEPNSLGSYQQGYQTLHKEYGRCHKRILSGFLFFIKILCFHYNYVFLRNRIHHLQFFQK